MCVAPAARAADGDEPWLPPHLGFALRSEVGRGRRLHLGSHRPPEDGLDLQSGDRGFASTLGVRSHEDQNRIHVVAHGATLGLTWRL